MLGRLLLTVDAIGMCVGTLKADFFNESHMYNPNWPPHAKYALSARASLFCFFFFFETLIMLMP